MLVALLLGTALAGKCPPVGRNTEIVLELQTVPTQLRTDRSRSQLSAGMGDTQGRHLGLTEAVFSVETAVQISVSQTNDAVCAHLDQVQVMVGYHSMTIHVASDYAPDTCEYAAIYNHEQLHVQFNNDVLAEYSQNLEAAISRIIERLPSMSTANAAGAARQVNGQINRKLSGTVSALDRDRARRNGMIDTRESYERTNAQCQNW